MARERSLDRIIIDASIRDRLRAVYASLSRDERLTEDPQIAADFQDMSVEGLVIALEELAKQERNAPIPNSDIKSASFVNAAATLLSMVHQFEADSRIGADVKAGLPDQRRIIELLLGLGKRTVPFGPGTIQELEKWLGLPPRGAAVKPFSRRRGS
jgi:hypothetical protein